MLQNSNSQKIEVLNILNGYKEPWCGLSDKSPIENIISLVELGANYSNAIASIGLETGNEQFLFRIITALGFVAKDNDVIAIKLLEKHAYAKNSLQGVAIKALFRIGGNSISKNINYIIQLNNEDISYQIELLEEVWLIDNLSDLIEIKKTFDSVTKDYANEKIIKYIETTLLNRISHAIHLIETPKSKESVVLMNEIFQFNLDNSFLFVNKWVSLIWVMSKLISLNDDTQNGLSIIDNVKKTMAEKGYSDPGHLTEFILYSKYKLGKSPTQDEIEWMNQNKISPINFTFEIFQNAEDLIDYYNFRQKYIR